MAERFGAVDGLTQFVGCCPGILIFTFAVYQGGMFGLSV